MIPPADNPWLESARYMDALAEEQGIEDCCERIGVDLPVLMHVAEQRALRTVLMISGRSGELKQNSTDREQRVLLNPVDQAAVLVFQAAVLDALVVGYQARVIEERSGE